jgi:hypothetical protein
MSLVLESGKHVLNVLNVISLTLQDYFKSPVTNWRVVFHGPSVLDTCKTNKYTFKHNMFSEGKSRTTDMLAMYLGCCQSFVFMRINCYSQICLQPSSVLTIAKEI